MSEVELFPCPFCGEEAELFYREDYDAHTLWKVECTGCCCCTNEYYDNPGKEHVIEAWNTRKPLERIIEELKERAFEHSINANQCEEDGYSGTNEREIAQSYRQAILIVEKEARRHERHKNIQGKTASIQEADCQKP